MTGLPALLAALGLVGVSFALLSFLIVLFSGAGLASDLGWIGGNLGALERFGITGRGTLSLDFRMKDEKGSARFSVKGAAFEPVSILGLRFPLDAVETIRGAVLINYGAVEVESLTLEGPELFARVSGTLNPRAVDMQIELMPKTDTFPDPTLAQLLAPYKVGRGHYVVPLKVPLGGRP